MDRKDALSRIIFLIRELEFTRERLKSAGPHALEIELALLNQQVLSLYSQIQFYNRMAAEEQPKQTTSNKQPIKIPIEDQSKPFNGDLLKTKPVIQENSNGPSETIELEPTKIDEGQKKEAVNTNLQTSYSQVIVDSMEKEKPPVKENKFSSIETAERKEKEIIPPEMQVRSKPDEQKNSEKVENEIASVYARAREKAMNAPEKKSESEPLESVKNKPTVANEPALKRPLGDKLKLTPINDLRTAISINQRIAFTNQLFHGDDKEFRRVISFLNNCSNFAEAKMFLQSEVATSNKWDMENPLVEELMELSYRKYL